MSNILTNKELDSILNTKYSAKTSRKNIRGGQPADLEDQLKQLNVEPVPEPVLEQVSIENQTLDSVTSEVKPEELAELANLEKVPEEVSGKFYHVVLDSDFGDFVDDARRPNRPAVIFGKIAKKINDRIPVVFNKEDAFNIAKKLINMVVAKGSIGVGPNKKYPYLGAVIVGFNFKDYTNVKFEKVNVGSTEERNYDHVVSTDKDLVYWEVNGVIRGTIAKSALTNTKIVDGEYVVRKDIHPDNGFALLNLVPSLSVDDVQTLMCMYRGEGRKCYGHGSAKESKNVELKIDVVSKGEVQLGGKYNDFRELAIREKAKYLLNKRKGQTGGNQPDDLEEFYRQKYIQKKNEYLRLKSQNGGKQNYENDENGEDEEMWRQKYIQKKNEYLRLKSQNGGKQNYENGEDGEDEEMWRQKYIQKKNEYLKLKSQNGGQKGGVLEHPTEDEEFWKPLYQQKKAEYMAMKNKK
jgi:hypothetical protein